MFTAAVVLTLTVGLGGSTAILGLMYTVYRSALPFANGDELVRLRSFADAAGGRRMYNRSPRDFYAIREGNRVFEGVVAMDVGSLAIMGDDGATWVSAISVTEGWGEFLGIRPQRGRLFSVDEETIGADARVALISDGVWDRFFGRDPAALGRALGTTEGPLSVVGVLPPRFAYPYDAGVWTPRHLDPSAWQTHDLNVVARRSAGVSLDMATSDLARVFGALKTSLARLSRMIDVGLS